MLHGINIVLHEQIETGRDKFNFPIFTEKPVVVKNVLVSPATSDDVSDSLAMYGRKAIYTLAIPKGDTHDWENKRVQFFGKEWKTFGIPLEGIEENIPLEWNKKVMVERYE